MSKKSIIVGFVALVSSIVWLTATAGLAIGGGVASVLAIGGGVASVFWAFKPEIK